MKIRVFISSVLFGASIFTTFSSPSRAQPTIEVPFSFDNKRIKLIGEYNRKHTFDLGVSLFHPSSIDVTHPAFQNRLSEGSRRQIGVTSSYSPTSIIPAIRIGGYLINDIEVFWDRPYVLGFDFFKKNAVQIDYRSGTITFFNGGSYKRKFDETVGPDRNVVMKVTVKVRNDSKPICRVVAEEILVNGKKAKVLIALDATSNQADGPGNWPSLKVNLEFGKLKLDSVPVFDANMADYDYVLDLSTLRRDGITIDLGNKRIAFSLN